MSSKAKATLYLSEGKPRKDGLCPISIRVSFQRERRYYSTGQAMKPIDFRKIKDRDDRGLIIKSADQLLAVTYLSAKERLIEAEAIINKRLAKLFTFGLFEQLYLTDLASIETVSGGFDRYIKELRSEGRIGTAVTYECAKKSIEAFCPNCRYADITSKWLLEYEKRLTEQGKSKSTIGIYLRSLRSVFNQAEIDKSIYPFGKGRNRYTIPSTRNVKKALNVEELKRIFQYQPQKGSYEEMARDYWIFLCQCNGMNVKDMCRLKRKNLKGELLVYQRAKTSRSQRESQDILVSLKPETKAIINRWGQTSIDPEAYLFPHLFKGVSAEKEDLIIRQLTKLINKHMKRISRLLELNKPVTTYYARHSFATVLKRAGVGIEMISDLLGHGDIKTTENYLDSFEPDQIHEATQVISLMQ